MALDIEQTASLLADLRTDNTPLEKLPIGCRPYTTEQGYEVESVLRTRLEDRGLGAHAGYKIGCTTAVMQEFLNIEHPCAGSIMANTIHYNTADLKLKDFQKVGVECEIAVRMADDVIIEPGVRPTADRIARSVGACMAAIEVVENRHVDYMATKTPTLIADGFFGAGCVLGEENPHWAEIDLEYAAGRMFVHDTEIGDTEIGRGIGSAILGHPINALTWLVSHLSQTGQILKAGEVVLLGSITETHWVEQPETIVVEIENLGRAEVTFS
ncbi:MAG: hypothetical protein HOK36_02865 [Rhodospirillales bacterium]|nr:hypothetical protein [Rhodospirillales bacterium]